MTGTSESMTVRRRPKDRADRIRAAAAELFRERGYHDVGMADVGEKVGITASAFYRHYQSKEALLIAVVEHEVSRLLDLAELAAEKGTSPLETLDLMNGALVRATIRDQILSTMYAREVRHAPFEDRAGIRVLQQRLTGLWSSALMAVHPDLDSEEAEFIVLSSYGAMVSQLFFNNPMSRRRQEALVTDVCLAAQLAWQPDGKASRRSDPDQVPHRRIRAMSQSPNLDEPVEVAARASRREMILQGAVGLLRRYGYQGVGIDDIGAAAGISGPGVYRHFKGKEEILLAAYQRAAEQLLGGVAKSLEVQGSPADVLDHLVESYVSVAFDNADLIVIYLRDDQHLGDEQRRALRQDQRMYVDEWVRILRQVEPTIDEDEARTRVHAALGIVNSAVDIPTRLDEDRQRGIVEKMLVGVLTPG